MLTRRTCLASLGAAATVALAGCALGTPVSSDPARADPTSAAFDDGDALPARYTCDGAGVSPPVSLDAPDDAETWALVVTDPDAPGGTFTHWLVWNLTDALPEAVPHGETVGDGARQGLNDFGARGYGAPCPPHGDGPHRYRFDAYALAGTLDVPLDVGRAALVDACHDADLLTVGSLRATYERA
ncbi:MAG: YbhB/YbcL family Raf kinase inhibitor-like protein [Halarchaeum sp.]